LTHYIREPFNALSHLVGAVLSFIALLAMVIKTSAGGGSTLHITAVIFFYMMNVQKIGLYGILKAIGVKTSSLFKMMWTQMIFITVIALGLSIVLSQAFNLIAPEGMPFSLTVETTIQLSIVFLVIGFIGATLSGIQIKKVEPLQAIQQGEV